MNITEDYCSYDVAKLLKEKGFDTFKSYGWDEQLFDKEHPRNFSIGFDNKEHWISCPTLQMAMKWLREKGIECVVIPIWNTLGKQYRSYVLSDLGDRYKDNYDSYSNNISYKDAVETALKYCLENLI